MMFICGNCLRGDRERSHRLQVLRRGLAVLARDQLVSHLLAFVQGGQAGLLHRRDMHEHVLRTVVCLNETKTLRCVEPLHFSGWHKTLLGERYGLSARPTARSFARSARTCTPGRSAIPSAWTRATTYGSRTRDRTWWSSSTPGAAL